MKKKLLVLFVILTTPVFTYSQVADPIADFKTTLVIPPSDKILKWAADVDGDGKVEIFLSIKSDFNEDVKNHEPQGWLIYFSQTPGNAFWKSAGTEASPGQLGVGDIPQIDIAACFVGQITELGKRGIVTMRINNPRADPAIAIVYAYTIEGDHLKRTELGRYDPAQTPSALFQKYLAADKRTQVQLQELAP